MLKVVKLSKQYAGIQALSNVSFSVSQGEIVGIIGPNGSGKTTLLNILIGLVSQTEGNYHFHNNVRVSMAISRMGFFDDMTVERNLSMYSDLQGIERDRMTKISKMFQVNFGSKRFGELSSGMKQKVNLTLGCASATDLLLLDEPTNHLDVDSIFSLREYMVNFKALGGSIVMTSHVLSDLEKVCTSYIFLKSGEIIKEISQIDLFSEYSNLEDAYLKIMHEN